MNHPSLVKPLLRGHFHQAAFFISVGACAMLVAHAQGFIEVISTLIYTVGLAGLLGVSALYHRPNWSIQKRRWMRRLDHSMIFVLIAGTFTPICLLALPQASGTKLLGITWIVATLGIVQSLFWVNLPKWVSAIIYVGFGWLIVPYLPELQTSLDISAWILLFLGGLAYTAGAVTYALRWPNPSPRFFGYHEIFHALVIIGAGLHFVMINNLVIK